MSGNGIIIAGVDPGIAKAGITIINVPYHANYNSSKDAIVKVAEIFKSKKDARKERRQDEDLTRRLRKFVIWYRDIFDKYKPKIIISESLSYPRNARSSAMLAMAWGSIQTYSILNKIPTCIYRPQEIKEGIGLAKNASKQQVEDKVKGIWEFEDWPTHGQREHAFDAAGAVMTFLNDENLANMLLGI